MANTVTKIKVNNEVYDIDDEEKQPLLVSGKNIKTINKNSLLGEGDITISGGEDYSQGTGITIKDNTISIDTEYLTKSVNVLVKTVMKNIMVGKVSSVDYDDENKEINMNVYTEKDFN